MNVERAGKRPPPRRCPWSNLAMILRLRSAREMRRWNRRWVNKRPRPQTRTLPKSQVRKTAHTSSSEVSSKFLNSKFREGKWLESSLPSTYAQAKRESMTFVLQSEVHELGVWF